MHTDSAIGNGKVSSLGKEEARNYEGVSNNVLLYKGNPIDLDIDISYSYQPIYRKIVTSIIPNGTNEIPNFPIACWKIV